MVKLETGAFASYCVRLFSGSACQPSMHAATQRTGAFGTGRSVNENANNESAKVLLGALPLRWRGRNGEAKREQG
jgi:hypothetical protein